MVSTYSGRTFLYGNAVPAPVFEEFARTVQPAVDPFVFSNTADINPLIFAEFAHVVYRFGHSMLTETVARTDIDNENGDPI